MPTTALKRLVALLVLASSATITVAVEPAQTMVIDRPANTGLVVVGDITLALKPPPGFVDVTDSTEQLRATRQFSTPPSHRRLAMMLSESDAGLLAAGKAPLMDHYLVVQMSRRREADTISPQDFAALRSEFQRVQSAHIQAAAAKAQSNLDGGLEEARAKFQDPSFKIQIGEIRPVRIFNESASTIAMSAISSYQATVNGTEAAAPVALSASLAVLKGKLVYLYAYSHYRSKADLEWTETISQSWGKSLVEAN